MAAYGNLNVSTINDGAIGTKNAIINGNFGINQRGVSGTVTLAAGAYGHDRWKAGSSGCTYTFATSENVTTLTISAGSLIQVIEGINLQTGTYTLSWQGTAQGKIGAGSYGNSGITGSVTGGTNLNIEFGTGTVRLVQLEKGSVATPFEFWQYGTELALCQRYYWRTGGTAYAPFGVAASNNTTTGYMTMPLPVSMRVPPTATTQIGSALAPSYGAYSSLTIDRASVGAVTIKVTGSSFLAGGALVLSGNADATTYIEITGAEF